MVAGRHANRSVQIRAFLLHGEALALEAAIVEFPGHPLMTTSNFTLVPLNVTVALPEHDASASVIGGFSFELLSSALNVGAGVGVGDGLAVGLGDGVRLGLGAAAVPPHAARTSVKLAIPARRRMATSFSSRTGIRQ